MPDEQPTEADNTCRYVPPVNGDKSDRRQYCLAYYWLTGYFLLDGAYFYLSYLQVDKEALASMKEVINYLTPLTGVVLGFFYTASVSGRRKDEAIANMAGSTK